MYDLFVIGAGPGGYTAALLAAKKGLRVGIAEGARMGGTCSNTGCIPTKTYIESINLFSRITAASRFGIEAGRPVLTLGSLNKRKSRIITRLAKGVEQLLKDAAVDIYPQPAQIIDQGRLTVGDRELVTRSLIVASGSTPKKPALFGVKGIWTSDTIFDVTELPQSLAIVGGGVIGMEMAHIFSTLGCTVSIIEAMDRILPSEDPEVSAFLAKAQRKVSLHTSSQVKDIHGDGPYELTLEKPGETVTLAVEKILLCIGRAPVMPQGLERLGIEINKAGGIRVDDTMQTSIPGIYAIGDVTGEHMYAYVASKEAGVAVDHLTGGSRRMNYRNIPTIIFTDPEIASAGKNLDEIDHATARHGMFPLSALGRARTMEAHDGYAHIICAASGRIERVTIVSPHATELIGIATLAIDRGLTAEDYLGLYHPHPTLSELLKEASEDVLGLCVHKP